MCRDALRSDAVREKGERRGCESRKESAKQ